MKAISPVETSLQQHSSKLWLAAGLVLAGLYLFFLNPYIDIGYINSDDPSSYLARAIGLLQGKGHGEEFVDGFYPVLRQTPGFSMLLVPIVALWGVHFTALKLYMVFQAGLMAAGLIYFFRYFLNSKTQAYVAALIFMACPIIFALAHRLMAETSLMAAMVLLLAVLDRYLQEDVKINSALLYGAAILFAVSFLLKPVPGLLAGGWLLVFHPRFRTKKTVMKLLAFTALCTIPVIAWLGWTSTQPSLGFWGRTYSDDILLKNGIDVESGIITFKDILIRIRQNLIWGMASNAGEIVFAPLYFLEGSKAGFLMGFPVLIWVLWQGIIRFIKQPSTLEGFLFATLLLFVVKGGGMAARYISSIYPVISVYVFNTFHGRLPEKLGRGLVLLWLLVSVATTALMAAVHARNPYLAKTNADFVALTESAKTLPTESICIAPRALQWQLLTGHRCFNPGKVKNSEPSIVQEASYLVIPSDAAKTTFEVRRDFENDLLQDAYIIKSQLNRSGLPYDSIAKVGSFEIVRVKQS